VPIHATSNGWILETDSTGYAFAVDDDGYVRHRYWGARLPAAEDYPSLPGRTWNSFADALTREEYPGYGGFKFSDPCLKLAFADGVRDVVLRFERAVQATDNPAHAPAGQVPAARGATVPPYSPGYQAPEGLDVYLHDAHYPLVVVLHYRLHPAYDLIERSVTLRNDGDTPTTLERAWSAQWPVPKGDQYRLTHLAGRWADENHLVREPLTRGIKRYESRRINTSHQHEPWFALDRGTADEDQGKVWFGALAWSGNWAMAAEVNDSGFTHVSAGLNDWDFAWRLDPGASFTTPPCFGGYSASGFGAASRHLHDFVRDALVPHEHAPHKVLYNSWEVTNFDVDEPSQVDLARIAAALGVELFVMDDGWFHGRGNDKAGLGDWWPDEQKFPRGLTPLIEQVNAMGMDFGLWIEPEMVNPDSDLYRAHPEWVIHFPTRHRTEARNQLVLNVARADVQAYLIDKLDRLLADHHISFIKWDMNRSASEPGWPDAPADAREIWVRYVEGLYHVWGTLRARHPQVTFQSCSGGGGRADLAILRLADQIWVSDNTEATARLGIQEGFSQVFPASAMEAWVTEWGGEKVPLTFRLHVAMCGVLGIGGHISRWTADERAEAARWIGLYKEIRSVVQEGDQYRLWSPQAHPFAAVQYISKDRSQGVLFAFRTWLPFPAELPMLYPRGLDGNARYEIDGEQGVRSGAGWMHGGLQLTLGNLESTVRRIRRVD